MRMPFGKHSGQPLHELPDDYLEWLEGIDLRADRFRDAVKEEARRRRGEARALMDIELATEIVKAGRKAMALRHHPDRGGSAEIMKRINETADRVVVVVNMTSRGGRRGR